MGNGAAPLSPGATPMAGPYMATPRGPTSRDALTIAWDFPVYEAKPLGDGNSRAKAARRRLELADAFEFLAADDPRPLLVLRECLTCNGTDDALLTREADNEKTMLMSRWFRCVKLPPNVLEEDHPFHGLFADEDPGHLFVASPDGTNRRDLNGQQSRTELWKVMEGLLHLEYASKPAYSKSLKKLSNLLDEFDSLDADIRDLEKQIDKRIEDDGPGSRKLKGLAKKLDKAKKERAEARAEAERLTKLSPRPAEEKAKLLKKKR